jgi:hypothetical protein
MTTPPLDDLAQLADMALQEQLSRRGVRWACAYCYHEVPYEGFPHCGEVHSEPITEGDDDE